MNPLLNKNIYLDDLGGYLHTALRKLCDSDPTSAMWNLFNLLPQEIWGAYLDVMRKELETSKDILATVKDVSCEFREKLGVNEYRELKDKIPTALTWINLMVCTFGTFSDDDFHGYAYWILKESEND